MITGKVAKSLLAGAALGALYSPAYAQDEDGVNDNIIIVTANKREQNLQETPIAITALTAEEVEIQGISNTQDLSGLAPNVAVNGGTTNATSSVVTIRGIPTNADETQGFDSPIGIYLDGVFLARSSASSFEIADIERVEVLRGPQGTLFGRNTTGGAVNFISKRPTDEASGRFRFGYGNYDSKSLHVLANTGTIGDAGRMSFAYLYKQRDGVVDNLLEPRNSRDPGGYETHSARFALDVDLSDTFRLYNVADFTRIKGVPHANQVTAVGDGTFRPNVTINGNTFAQVQPANVAGYLNASVALEPQCGTPISNIRRARLDPICLEGARPSTDTLWGNMTRLEWDASDTITVRSTTAFREWKNTIEGSDLDGLGTTQGPLFSQASLFNGMPANLIGFVLPPAQQPFAPFIAATPVPTTTQPLFQARNDREQDQFSQEIEIIGGSGTSFEWVLGGFYFQESGTESNPQTFGFILDTNQAVFTDAAFGAFLGAGFRAANPERFRLTPVASTLAYSVSGKSYAIYGQGTWRPSGPDGPLGVTLGLRYTWDEKEITRTQNGAAPFATAAELALNTQRATFSEPTGNLTIDYRFNPDFNVFARAARGYRSGGFNARQSTSVANNIGLIPFNEEKIWSFELGAKTQPIDGLTLNGSVFYNIYDDQQATVPDPDRRWWQLRYAGCERR